MNAVGCQLAGTPSAIHFAATTAPRRPGLDPPPPRQKYTSGDSSFCSLIQKDGFLGTGAAKERFKTPSTLASFVEKFVLFRRCDFGIAKHCSPVVHSHFSPSICAKMESGR